MLEKTSERKPASESRVSIRRSSQPRTRRQTKPTPTSPSAAPISAVHLLSEAQIRTDRGAGDHFLDDTQARAVAGHPTSERQECVDTQLYNALAEAPASGPLKPKPEAQGPQPKRRRQVLHETQLALAPVGDDGPHSCCENPQGGSAIVASIRRLWPIRQAWHRAEKRLILAAKAKCRMFTDGDKDKADKLFDRGLSNDAALEPEAAFLLRPFLTAIEPLAKERKAIERRLIKLAGELPIHPWVKKIKGFGEKNLAGIVGEAGDIGSYRNTSCLWKRMGLAVIGGERQRKLTDVDLALIHGYSPQRRSVAYQLGESLAKHQLTSAAKSGTEYGQPVGPYGEVYVTRRTRTATTHPEWSKAHSANDARRVMTKAALRDLWAAWRLVALTGAAATAAKGAEDRPSAAPPGRPQPAAPSNAQAAAKSRPARQPRRR